MGSDPCSVGDRNQFELQLCHSFGYHPDKEPSAPNLVLGDNGKVAGGWMRCTCTSERPRQSALPCPKVMRRLVRSLWLPLTLQKSREKQMHGKGNWCCHLALEGPSSVEPGELRLGEEARVDNWNLQGYTSHPTLAHPGPLLKCSEQRGIPRAA